MCAIFYIIFAKNMFSRWKLTWTYLKKKLLFLDQVMLTGALKKLVKLNRAMAWPNSSLSLALFLFTEDRTSCPSKFLKEFHL